MAVTRIEEGGLGTDSFNLPITLNGTDGSSTDAGDNIVLDASASGVDAGERVLYEGIPPDFANISDDTSVLAGATLTVNDNGAISVASGGSVTIDSGATITNNGTATGFGGSDPSSADGDSLGTASLEWSDLYLADGGVVYFGNDQEITLTHSADSGLLLKHTATADDKPINLVLQTGETDMAANDVIGKISFQAPDEGTGTDAVLVAAGIEAVSEGNFSSSNNATKLSFKTAASEAASEKMALSSAGALTISGALIASDGAVATPSITFEADLDTGFYHDDGDSGVIRVTMNGTQRQLWTNGGMVALSETANANMTTGITINQGTAYNEMLALKNSNVAHGCTGLMETDNFFYAGIYDSSTGGVRLESVSENTTAFWTRVAITTESTGDATNSTAAYYHIAATKSGTGKTPMADAANMIMWSNDGTGRVLFKGDGTVHASDTSWATSLDTEDDMKALRMLDKAQSTSGIITSAWDSMIGTDWEYLQKIGVAGSTHSEKGHPDMFSMQGIQKLTMGATWYLGQNFMAFLETVEKRMPGIRKEFEDHMLEQSGRPAMLTEN